MGARLQTMVTAHRRPVFRLRAASTLASGAIRNPVLGRNRNAGGAAPKYRSDEAARTAAAASDTHSQEAPEVRCARWFD